MNTQESPSKVFLYVPLRVKVNYSLTLRGERIKVRELFKILYVVHLNWLEKIRTTSLEVARNINAKLN